MGYRFPASLAMLSACAVLLTGCPPGSDGPTYLATTRDKAAQTSLAVLSAVRWDDIASRLQPDFSLTAAQALDQVVPTTAFGSVTVRDAFGFSAGIGLPTSTTQKTSTSQTTDGTTTDTATTTSSRGPGTAPAAPGLASPGTPGTALAGAAGEPGVDPFLKYDIAKSLFEFVQMLNQTVRNVAYDSETEEAYLVRLRVGVVPLARRQPFDVYSRLSFFLDEQASPTPPAYLMSNSAPPAQAPRAMLASAETWPQTIRPRPQTPAAGDLAADPPARQGGRNANAGKQATSVPLRIIPLLATDNLEASLRTRAEDQVRQFGLAVSLMVQNVGGNISASKLDEILKAFKARDYASLFVITPLTPNTLQARFGAQSNGEGGYTMQERNQDITVLVIAPIAKPADKRHVDVVARTTLRNPLDGAILPRPERAAVFAALQQDLTRVFDDSKVPPVDPHYEADVKGCGGKTLADPKTGDVRTRDFLISLYGAVTTNQVDCFKAMLAAARWPQYYWTSIWNEIAGFSGLSEFSSARFLLPALEPLDLTTARLDDPVTLLDDGKQASQTVIRINPKIAPNRLIARLDIASNQHLYGMIGAGPAAGLLKLQFPSLADTGLKPDSGSRLHLEDAGDASNTAAVKIVYKLAPSAANPGFQISQAVKTMVASADATGTVNLKVAFANEGGARIADSVVISTGDAEITAVTPAGTATLKDGVVTVTGDAFLQLSLRQLVPGQKVTFKATGKKGKETTAAPASIEFAIAAPPGKGGN